MANRSDQFALLLEILHEVDGVLRSPDKVRRKPARRNHAIEIKLPDAQSATALTVDESTADNPPRTDKPTNGILKLEPFAVSVVTW